MEKITLLTEGPNGYTVLLALIAVGGPILTAVVAHFLNRGKSATDVKTVVDAVSGITDSQTEKITHVVEDKVGEVVTVVKKNGSGGHT